MKVSNSCIQTYKACRRMYQLKYIFNMIPAEKSEALERGASYHEAVEALVTGAEMPVLQPKIQAMLNAFKLYILPKLDFAKVEEWKEYKIGKHTIFGRVDGIAENGAVIEHKTVSGDIDNDYLLRLEMDEQIPTYLIACHTQNIIYAICSAPTIRQKQNETDDEYIARCAEWYAESPATRCMVLRLRKTEEELKEFKREQRALLTEMNNCKHFYRNPNNCIHFGKICAYAPICKRYDPTMTYINFTKREDKENGSETVSK